MPVAVCNMQGRCFDVLLASREVHVFESLSMWLCYVFVCFCHLSHVYLLSVGHMMLGVGTSGHVMLVACLLDQDVTRVRNGLIQEQNTMALIKCITGQIIADVASPG